MNSASLSIVNRIHFNRAKAGRKTIAKGPAPAPKAAPPDPIPRIARLMALAIHFEGLIRQGLVKDYADLARLGGVSRARITQIMNLLNLPPWRQEELLFSTERRLSEREMRGESSFRRLLSESRMSVERAKLGSVARSPLSCSVET